MNRHWALKLGDVCEVVSGATPKTGVNSYWDGDVPWVTPADLSKLDGPYISDTPRKITASGLASCSSRLLPPNSVLLSSRAPIGHVAINTVPMATNQGFKSLVPKQGLIESKFLYHWLRHNKGQIQALGNGATFKEVSKATVAEIGIDLPTIEDQRRIAAILDKADALRQKRKRAIALLESLTQSVFAAAIAKSNAPAEPLAESLDFITSGGRNWARYLAEQGSRFIRSFDVQNGWVSDDDAVFVAPPDNAEAKRTRTKKDDVLLTITGSRIGRAAPLPDKLQGSYISQHVAILRLDQSKVQSKFLAAFLVSDLGQRQIAKWQYGQTKPGLNFEQIGRFKIPMLSVQDQIDFIARSASLVQRKSMFEESASNLETLFASLQHRAFSGQL